MEKQIKTKPVIRRVVRALQEQKRNDYPAYVKRVLSWAHYRVLCDNNYDGYRKPPCEYSMGYKMTINFDGISVDIDTRSKYRGKKYYGREYHPHFVINVNKKEFEMYSRLFIKDEIEKNRKEIKKYNTVRSNYYNVICKRTHPSECEVLSASMKIYYIDGHYINDNEYDTLVNFDFFQKYIDRVLIYYDWTHPSDHITRMSHYIPRLIESYIQGLITYNSIHYALAFFERSPKAILSLRNEELKRKIAEYFGGFESIIKKYGEVLSTGSDGKHPITLYCAGDYNYLLCKDHSTYREYLLCPPNQDTRDAYEAWKSTFPVSIAYRQGDVGLSLLDDKGGILDIGMVQQS